MKLIVDFIATYGVFSLSVLTASLWYFFIFEAKPRSFIRLLAFPASHFRAVLNIRENPPTFPIAECYLTFLGGIALLIAPSSPYVYLTGWSLLMMYELFGLTAYILRLKNMRSFLISMGIILLFVGYGAVKTVQMKDYQFMNNIDFIQNIYLFAGSVFVIGRIIIKDRFIEELDAFFVFFGLIIYAFLHLLATSVLTLDFVQNFDFAYYATLITMLFWLVNIPWIRHLRSKHT